MRYLFVLFSVLVFVSGANAQMFADDVVASQQSATQDSYTNDVVASQQSATQDNYTNDVVASQQEKTQEYYVDEAVELPDLPQKKAEETSGDVGLSFEQEAYKDPLANWENSSVAEFATEEEPEVVTTQEEEKPFVAPEDFVRDVSPTTDGSQRGGSYFVEIDEDGNKREVKNIFLFYDNFKIVNATTISTHCNVRFNILSNIDTKITQLDLKLVWPKLTTTLSFSGVNPDVLTYMNYSLLGEGCLEMDKAPNIIVNRCRIKGMSASECANKLIWLTK